jgi:hypothetical protein
VGSVTVEADPPDEAPEKDVSCNEENSDSWKETYIRYDTKNHEALQIIKEDVGRQLGLASDRQNLILQSVGILLAFASVLFVPMAIVNTDIIFENSYFTAAMILVFLCCLVGVCTLILSGAFTLSSGLSVKNEIYRYNTGDTKDLEIDIVNSMNEAREDITHSNGFLTKIIRWMAFLLFIGILLMLIGWK